MTSAEAGRLTRRPAVAREPLGRVERLQLAVLAGMFVLLAAILSAGAIAFTSLSGQILGLQEQMGDFRAEMHEEIGGLRAGMHEEIGELSERMTRIETLIQTHLVPVSDARDPAGP